MANSVIKKNAFFLKETNVFKIKLSKILSERININVQCLQQGFCVQANRNKQSEFDRMVLLNETNSCTTALFYYVWNRVVNKVMQPTVTQL